MTTRQTRIFVPPVGPYAGASWAETVLGKIIAPLTQDASALSWWWFSRYALPRGVDDADCVIANVPAEFEHQGPRGPMLRSARFRWCLDTDDGAGFEEAISKRIASEGGLITGIIDYDVVRDLGSGRFLREEPSEARSRSRALRVVEFLHATSELAVDCLHGPEQDGAFRLEEGAAETGSIRARSSFEVPHHLLHNMTAIDTHVGVAETPGGILVQSPHHQALVSVPVQPTAVRVRF